MKEKRKGRGAVVAAVIITFFTTVCILLLGLWLAVGTGGLKLIESMAVVKSQFVGPLDEAAVTDAAMEGMVRGLGDRWSYYMNEERWDQWALDRENVYVGVGITVTYDREEGLLIQRVDEGGPAALAGLIPGEIITAVDGVSIAGEARHRAADLIQGELGTAVTLELLAEDGSTRSVTIERGAVPTSPVTYELLEGGVGYIKLLNFHDRCAKDAQAAAEELIAQGATALVFDVRNNGGGYVHELTPLLDYLLPEGPTFRMRTRSGRETVYESDADCVDLPMAVLVNSESYSAAEIFAGQLREAGAAVVVGTGTSGKGYAQNTFPLIGGGVVGLSTFEYFTGGGVSLVGTGVTLDAEVELDEARYALLRQGALDYGDDPQLQKAVELLS